VLLDIGTVLAGIGLAVVGFVVVIVICAVILALLAAILPSYEGRTTADQPSAVEPKPAGSVAPSPADEPSSPSDGE
jgi:hypothetical protein